MKPYHPANLSLTPYAGWKVIILAWAARFLGIQFKIDGIPYGAPRRRPMMAAPIICQPVMIHNQSGTIGFVDDTTVHPDGKTMARINDHWFPIDECRIA